MPSTFTPPTRDELFSACFRRACRIDRRWDKGLWRFHELSAVLRLLTERPDLREGPVLDLGCGDGEVFQWLFGNRVDADGVDSGAARVSDLALARRAACYREVRQEDATTMSFQDGHYALVLANSVLEHIAPLAPALQEAARVLRPGGRLIITTLDPELYSWQAYSWRTWLRPVGLDFVGQAIARMDNAMRHHVSVLAENEWRAQLELAGFARTERIAYYPVELARTTSIFSGAVRIPRLQRIVEKVMPLAHELGRAEDDEDAWIDRCRRVLDPLLGTEPTARGCGQLLIAEKPRAAQVLPTVSSLSHERVHERPLRILWVCKHRIARFEEVGALLRTGAEVIPVTGEMAEFPNAVQLNEEDDPLYPRWRPSCSVPAEDLHALREYDYLKSPDALDPTIVDLLNRHIDIVWVASFSAVAAGLLRAFRGGVVLRSYGRYPYAQVLGHWPKRERALELLATSDRYVFCPALPYQGLVEDPRLTRGEIYWAAGVTRSRLGHVWAGRDSEPFASETISLIERYRRHVYEQYLANFGTLPLRIFGLNEAGGANRDPRIVGTLPDDAYNRAIASCRLMLYAGLGNKYHLHYHVIEAMMMGVPVVYFDTSALAHTGLFLGLSYAELRAAGMCASVPEARVLAIRLLQSPDAAAELSARQAPLRSLYEPAAGDGVVANLITQLGRRVRYQHRYADSADRPPPSALHDLGTTAVNQGRKSLGALVGYLSAFGK